MCVFISVYPIKGNYSNNIDAKKKIDIVIASLVKKKT